MNTTLFPHTPVWLITTAIFFLILFFNWLGFTLRKKQMHKEEFAEPSGTNIIENSLLGLTALLLAFTFNMAASKFENRKKIIVEEANYIGRAILRCDLYPDSVRNLLRADFKQYVEMRIAYFKSGEDEQKMAAALDTAAVYSGRIWKKVAALSNRPVNFARSGQMIPALNDMIDIVTTRDLDRKAKVPRLIFGVVLLFSLLSAFLSGYRNKTKRRNLLMIGSFAFMTTVSIYLIMELDRPKQGLVNLDISERAIEDLRKMLEEK